jgi:hypothetical protein
MGELGLTPRDPPTAFLDSLRSRRDPSPTQHQRRRRPPVAGHRQVCRRSSVTGHRQVRRTSSRRRPSAGPLPPLPPPATGRSAASSYPPASAPPFSASSFPRPPLPRQIDAVVPASRMRGAPPPVTTAVHRAFSPACACFGSTMCGAPSRLSARVARVAKAVCCGAARRLGGAGHQDPTAARRSMEGRSLQRDATHGSPRRRGRWCSVICARAASSAVDAPDGRRLPS